MDDLISRQAAIDAIEEYADRLQMADWKKNPAIPYKAHTLNWCINTIRDLSPAQPTIKPRKGKWIYNQKRGTVKIWTCSECGWNDIGEWNFCPNCGADMREEKEQ